ncbi:MAG: acyltransferase [Proteobacteria bacterium]|nr:acyltransferase [Pseudomonadota bacterium]
MGSHQAVAARSRNAAAYEESVVTLGWPAKPLSSSGLTKPYVPEVDALRCLAMTAVIAFHCGLFPAGWMGVWLFFVISGFAVTTSLFSKHSLLSEWHRIAAFYVRRALRIWPLYFFYVVVSVVVLLGLGEYGALREVPWLLSFTQNIGMLVTRGAPGEPWQGYAHLWTLSVEQQFYFILPFLLFLPSRLWRTLLLASVIVIAPLLRLATARWATAHGYDDLGAASIVYAFGPDHFDAFAIGALIAMFRTEITRNRRLAKIAAVTAASFTTVYVLSYMVVNLWLGEPFSASVLRNIVSGVLYGQGREVWAYFVPTVGGAAVLMSILAGGRGCLRICRLPGLQAIGRISYGGYLFHVPVLMILGSLLPFGVRKVEGPATYGSHILLFILTYVITIGVAWLSFNYFEERVSRIGLSKVR